MKKIIQVCSVSIMIMTILTYFIFDTLHLPVVMWSNSTDKCVKVLNYNTSDIFSCKNLPRKYNTVWVH